MRALLLALVLTLLPLRAAAQLRVAVRPEPGTPVVAEEVLLATGPADEDSARAGLAFLAARSVLAPVRPRLDSLGAHLTLTAHKDALGFTLVAAPDAWAEASRLLLVALFRDAPDSATVARERARTQAELAARQANPADAAARAADSSYFGAGHPWGRATVGSVASLGRVSRDDVDGFLRANFRPERAVVAVVGPVDTAQARARLADFVASAGRVRLESPPAHPAREPLWIDYNSITTWITATYPLPPGVDEEAVRFLAQLVVDELAFSPTRRSVFNALAEVEIRPDGGELRFQLVTPPGEAAEWGRRMQEVVAGAAGRDALADAFPARLRRYRGERLRELESPEARAREIARHLLVYGRDGLLLDNLASLSLERVAATARTLGRPAVVFLGPILDSTPGKDR